MQSTVTGLLHTGLCYQKEDKMKLSEVSTPRSGVPIYAHINRLGSVYIPKKLRPATASIVTDGDRLIVTITKDPKGSNYYHYVDITLMYHYRDEWATTTKSFPVFQIEEGVWQGVVNRCGPR